MITVVVLATPSPRVRGEGGVRGRCRRLSVASHHRTTETLPVSSESRQRPLILSFSPRAGRRKRERREPVSIPPLSRKRAEDTQASSFSRRASRPSFAARTKATAVSPPNQIRAAARRNAPIKLAAPHEQMFPPVRATGAARATDDP